MTGRSTTAPPGSAGAARRALLRAFVEEQQALLLDPSLRRQLQERAGPGLFKDAETLAAWAGEAGAPDAVRRAADAQRAASRTLESVVDALGGWPRRSSVGSAAALGAASFLAHADGNAALRDRLLPAMRLAVGEGEADARHYVHILDRSLAHAGRPQRYGTLIAPGTGDLYWPLADQDEADRLRRELGIGPVAAEQDAIRRGAASGPFLVPYRRVDWLRLAWTVVPAWSLVPGCLGPALRSSR